MKLRAILGCSLLLLTHAAVFLAARPRASSHAENAGEGMAQPGALPAAKSNDRQRPRPPSLHVGLIAELNASDLEGEEYDKAFAAIFRAWIKRDLRGALLFAFGPDSGNRHEHIAGECDEELRREMVAQAAQVGQWINSGCFGSRQAEVASAWVEALVKAGQGREIAVEALAHLPGPARVQVIDVLCTTAKGPELAELRQWMIPDSQGRVEDYAKRVVRFTGDDPAKIFAGEKSPKVLGELCKAYTERYVDSLPVPEAVAASLKLPESYRGDLLEGIAGRASGGLSAFKAMLAEMDRLGIWQGISADREGAIVRSAIQAHCGSYSLPEEIFAQLGGISRESTRLTAFRAAGDRIGNFGGAAVLMSALETLPKGKECDAFITGLWGGGMNFDEQTGARVLACVSEPDLRETLMEVVLSRDPSAGETTLPPPPSAE